MTTSRFPLICTMLASLLPFAALAQTDADDAAPAAKSGKYVTRDELSEAVRKVMISNPQLVTKEQLPDLISKILDEHPEIVTDSLKHMQEKQRADEQKKAQVVIATHKKEIYDDPNSPVAGSSAPDVTLVEFFDYHCGYCKRLLPAISKLLEEDKKVRIVFKEFPILSEDSTTAAQAALAVNRIAKDKYFEYHTALMKYNGKFDEEHLLDIAKGLGIDTAELKENMGKPEIAAQLKKDHDLAEALGVHGTPALIIGDALLPGALPYEELKKLVSDVRSGKKIAEPQYGE